MGRSEIGPDAGGVVLDGPNTPDRLTLGGEVVLKRAAVGPADVGVLGIACMAEPGPFAVPELKGTHVEPEVVSVPAFAAVGNTEIGVAGGLFDGFALGGKVFVVGWELWDANWLPKPMVLGCGMACVAVPGGELLLERANPDAELDVGAGGVLVDGGGDVMVP